MKIFETISFHIVKPCNMSCKFCYATFEDFTVNKQLSYTEIVIILDKLREAGVEKVTFAGGEPMLYKKLDLIITYAKYIGFTTSIITNGSFLTSRWLSSMRGKLDWIGISVDSLNSETNKKIGRVSNREELDYFALVDLINSYQYKLKINTVVNIHNQKEDLADFINYSRASRWKVFDTLPVKGQNDKQFEEIRSTEFDQFVARNNHFSMVVETNDLMTGSYLLVDPLGRLFENTQGEHTYSSSLINNSVEDCLSQITLRESKFIERGGIYKW